jgi:hypothetical protein
MNSYNTLSSNLKRGVLSFSEKISHGLPRPDFKFVSQMLYGMLASLAVSKDANYQPKKR